MLSKLKDFIANHQWAQFVLVFVVGVGVGALFYPTKHIEERVKQKYEEQSAKVAEEHKKEIASIQESFDKQIQSYKSVVAEKESKLNQLTVQISNLKKSQKTTYYKIIKPDGTVEVRKTSDSESEESTQIVTQIQQEFKEKVASIENKWETLHKQRVSEIKTEYSKKEEEYKKKISTLESEKIVDINPKKYGIEGGITTQRSTYLHVNADVFGPFFVGAHASTGNENSLGAGIGFRF